MFYKNFKNTLILIGIVWILFVTAHPVPVQQLLKEDHLRDLSFAMCGPLEMNLNMSEEVCNKKILESTFDSSVPSRVVIRCQIALDVWFQIPRSESWQVVILKPESKDYAIEIALVKPRTEYERIITMEGGHYSIWNTEIINGEAIKWQGGKKLPFYNESVKSESKLYDVSAQFFYSKNLKGNGLLPNAFFKWNKGGDGDVCFDVVDSCADIEKNHFYIWPNQTSEVVVTELPENKTCHLNVTGLYGTTMFTYKSPPCEDPAECEQETLKLRNPEKIYLMAYEADNGTWDVHVSWTRPVVPPKQYELTLRARYNKTRVVPGDVTDATFSGIESVADDPFYHVSIISRIDRGTHKSARGFFERRGVVVARGGGVGAGAAAAWCAGAAAAALLAACCWRRRLLRRASPADYYPRDYKITKEGDAESIDLRLETAEDSWEVRSDRLLLHEVIGEGAFGVVRKGSLAPGGKEVAVKMLKDFPSSEEIRSFRAEMELMKSVGVHRNIVSLVGCCSGRKPLIIAEYCSRGDLLSYLRCSWDVIVSKRNAKYYNNNTDTSNYRNDLFKYKVQNETSKLVVNKLYELQGVCEKELTALDLLSFCRQIAMGMEFLASNRVVHRDLAARNILVTSDKTLKIADFGLSRDVYEENQYKQKGNGKMPVKWMALESLTRRIYTTQSDVWSFGVVIWEVVTVGGSPYPEVPVARLVRLLRAGYRMPRPNNCSKELYELMQSCWHLHPRERPTFTELHEQLDELLNSACADQYLSLELEPDDPPPTPKPQSYIKMLIRGKRSWNRGESYERPLKAPHSNHYSSPPAILSRALPVCQ